MINIRNLSREELIEFLDHGQKVFEKLYLLNDLEVAKRINKILKLINFSETIPPNELEYDCIRVLRNGKPETIEFRTYDRFKIDAAGITYFPEHGPSNLIFVFTKDFNL